MLEDFNTSVGLYNEFVKLRPTDHADIQMQLDLSKQYLDLRDEFLNTSSIPRQSQIAEEMLKLSQGARKTLEGRAEHERKIENQKQTRHEVAEQSLMESLGKAKETIEMVLKNFPSL